MLLAAKEFGDGSGGQTSAIGYPLQGSASVTVLSKDLCRYNDYLLAPLNPSLIRPATQSACHPTTVSIHGPPSASGIDQPGFASYAVQPSACDDSGS